MLKDRLFHIFIGVALMVVIVLTISQAVETTKVVSAASVSPGASGCFSGMDRLSLTSVYMEEAKAWFPRTNKGLTGVDGGLIDLFSNSRGFTSGKE
jgi:hypothetical protein